MNMKRLVLEASFCVSLAVLASLLLAQEAHAYLDPGTGSYIFQILISGLVGALFMLKVFWGRIVGLFSKNSSGSAAPAQEPSQDMGEQVPTSENVQPSAPLERNDD